MGLSKKCVIFETNPPSPLFKNTPAHASWFVKLIKKINSKTVFDIYNVTNHEFPQSTEDIDGIIITGSSKEVYDDDTWIVKLKKIVKQLSRNNIPILGVCFGHQLLAEIYGGKVTKNPHGREIGTCTVSLLKEAMQDELFLGIPNSIYVQESHISAVVHLPKNAKLLAYNKFGNQAFRISDKPVWGVQFHPEVTSDILKKVVHFRRNLLEGEGIKSNDIYNNIRNTPTAVKIITNFVNFMYAHNKS